MNFKDLLVALSYLEESEFKAADIAVYVQKPTYEVSNGLRRLHRMGFLNGKKVKRDCLSKTGKSCKKGREYVYNISKQGRQYTDWMLNQPIKDTTHLEFDDKVKDTPESPKDEQHVPSPIKPVSANKGPSIQDFQRAIKDEMLSVTEELIVPYVARARTENQRLKTENNYLRTWNAILTSNNALYDGLVSELKKTINQLNMEIEKSEKMVKEDIPPLMADLANSLTNSFTPLITRQGSLSATYLYQIGLMWLILHDHIPKEEFIGIYEMMSKLQESIWKTTLEQTRAS